ncbi:MAG: hypothetical protein JWQ39_1071 [Glaciihabitans sp.]|nr:hypothetical protein [Glaciihabitans sp.]
MALDRVADAVNVLVTVTELKPKRDHFVIKSRGTRRPSASVRSGPAPGLDSMSQR